VSYSTAKVEIVPVDHPIYGRVYALKARAANVLSRMNLLDDARRQAERAYLLAAERLSDVPDPTSDTINAVLSDVQAEVGLLTAGDAPLSSRYTDGRILGLREAPNGKDSEIARPGYRQIVRRLLRKVFLSEEPLSYDPELSGLPFLGMKATPQTAPVPLSSPPRSAAPKPVSSSPLALAIFAKLTALGFSPLRGGYTEDTESVWSGPLPNARPIELRVFTTCIQREDGSWTVASRGSDAIRVIAYYAPKGDVPRALVAGRKMLRTGKPEAIVGRLEERIAEVAEQIRDWPVCPSCGAPLFKSKKGNWVCSDLCWKRQ
jgi:hypothetical protein